jgi:hypothetical protein
MAQVLALELLHWSSPSTPRQVGFGRALTSYLTHWDGESPPVLLKHATSTHKKTKPNESLELFSQKLSTFYLN